MNRIGCSQQRCSTAVRCDGGGYAAKRPTVLNDLLTRKLLPDFRQGFPAFAHPEAKARPKIAIVNTQVHGDQRINSGNGEYLQEKDKLRGYCATPELGKEEPNLFSKQVHGC